MLKLNHQFIGEKRMNRLASSLPVISAAVALSGLFLSGCSRKQDTFVPVPETVFRGMEHKLFELDQKQISTDESEVLKKIDSLLTESEKYTLKSYSEKFEVRSRIILLGIEEDIKAGVSPEEIAGGLKRLILELKIFEEEIAARIKKDDFGSWILERRTKGTWLSFGFNEFLSILERLKDKTYDFTSIPEEEKKKLTDTIIHHYKQIKLQVEALENNELLDPTNLHVADGYEEVLQYTKITDRAYIAQEKLFTLTKKLLENTTDPVYKRTVILSIRFALDLYENHSAIDEEDIYTLIEKLSESSSRILNVELRSFREEIDNDRSKDKQWKYHEHILPPILIAIKAKNDKELIELAQKIRARYYIEFPDWPKNVEVIPVTGLEYLDWDSVFKDIASPQKGSKFYDMYSTSIDNVLIAVGQDVRPGEEDKSHKLLQIAELLNKRSQSAYNHMTLYSPTEKAIDNAIDGMPGYMSGRLTVFLIGLGFTGKRVANESHDGFVVMGHERAISEAEIRWRSQFWAEHFKKVRIFVISDGAGAWVD